MATAKKKPATKKPATKKKTAGKSKPAAKSRGLDAAELTKTRASKALTALATAIEKDGGSVIGSYRDPVGGNWQLIAGLPIDKVEPTPFQRDLSKPHVARLAQVIDKLDRFLDPIVAVRTEAGAYWTPNGGHRLAATRELGGKSIVCLVMPEIEVAYKILALNTEKAHSLGEKCLEVIRMARALADEDDRLESEHELVFEDPAYLTLGCCYDKQARFSGSSYTSVLKKLEGFLDLPLAESLPIRAQRASQLLALDKLVVKAVDALKKAGFVGSSLKGFVIKAINPLDTSKRKATADFASTLEAMIAAAADFDIDAVDTAELPILAE